MISFGLKWFGQTNPYGPLINFQVLVTNSLRYLWLFLCSANAQYKYRFVLRTLSLRTDSFRVFSCTNRLILCIQQNSIKRFTPFRIFSVYSDPFHVQYRIWTDSFNVFSLFIQIHSVNSANGLKEVWIFWMEVLSSQVLKGHYLKKKLHICAAGPTRISWLFCSGLTKKVFLRVPIIRGIIFKLEQIGEFKSV